MTVMKLLQVVVHARLVNNPSLGLAMMAVLIDVLNKAIEASQFFSKTSVGDLTRVGAEGCVKRVSFDQTRGTVSPV